MPDTVPTHVIVLADDADRRDLPIWLLGQDSHRFADPDRRRGHGPVGRASRDQPGRPDGRDVSYIGGSHRMRALLPRLGYVVPGAVDGATMLVFVDRADGWRTPVRNGA